MGIPMHLLQLPNRDMGVDLGSRDGFVSEDLLEETEIGAVLQHQRCHRVTQQVGASALSQVRFLDVIVHHATQMVPADRFAILREK